MSGDVRGFVGGFATAVVIGVLGTYALARKMRRWIG